MKQNKHRIQNMSYVDTNMPIFRLTNNNDIELINNLLDHLSIIDGSLIIYMDDYTSYNPENYNKLRLLEPLLLDRPIYVVINNLFDMKSIAEILPNIKYILFKTNSNDSIAFINYLKLHKFDNLIDKIKYYEDNENYRKVVLKLHSETNKFDLINDSDQDFEFSK